jgi:lipopolysaccharide transport system ATP-binding protein
MLEVFDPDFRPTSTVEYESRGAVISNPGIFTLDGKPVNVLVRGRRYKYQYHVEFTQGAMNVRYGMMIKTVSGFELGGVVSDAHESLEFLYQSSSKKIIEFQFNCILNPGAYFLNAGVVCIDKNEEIFLHRILDACVFKVMPISLNKINGLVDFGVDFQVNGLAD